MTAPRFRSQIHHLGPRNYSITTRVFVTRARPISYRPTIAGRRVACQLGSDGRANDLGGSNA